MIMEKTNKGAEIYIARIYIARYTSNFIKSIYNNKLQTSLCNND